MNFAAHRCYKYRRMNGAMTLAIFLTAFASVAQEEERGPTTLIEAAAIGDEEAVRRFLDAGADLDTQGEDGGTALMRASPGGHLETVRMLLEAGADRSIRTQDGWSAMRLAISVNHQEVVELLRVFRADNPQPAVPKISDRPMDPSSDTESPARPGNDVEPPVLLEAFNPPYPETARARGAEGDVIVEAIITKSGEVVPVRIIRSVDLELDRKAVEAARRWNFRPGRLDGEPVDVIVEIAVAFKLLY